MLRKLSDTTQTITFSEADGITNMEVFSQDVVVTTTAGTHNHGSSMVKLKNLVDYNWEAKFYTGQLLAIHMSGKYLAYSIKAPNTVNPGTWSGMVRVVYNPEPGTDRRVLIKGMKGEVHDLAFAHVDNEVLLASIDEQGNFFVHAIEVTDSGLRCSLLLDVREEASAPPCSEHRVVWCPYIPDEDDSPDEDVARLLLTTHSNTARIWNLRPLIEEVGVGARVPGAVGCVCTSEHAGTLVAAAFSPDGTALATAARDGTVMFFQVYMHNETTPRCLHKWQPHGGKPLSCLFFLDNHKNYNSEVQFWKFAVTGADNNTTLKVWSCKSWTCLQTITFQPEIPSEPSLGLKAVIDTSATYLLLSDFKARSLYVLHMGRDEENSVAYCKSISEFLLPYPVLSFCIVDACEETEKSESAFEDAFNASGAAGERDVLEAFTNNSDTPSSNRVRISMYIVQPKGLQEGELIFAPMPSLQAPTDPLQELADVVAESSICSRESLASTILQQQTQQLQNLLMRNQTQPGSLISQRPESPNVLPTLNLMTPDAFSSPGKRDDDDPPLSATPDISKQINKLSISATSTAAVNTCEEIKSCGSSPSREVQQIMSPRDLSDRPTEEDEEEECASPSAPQLSSTQNGPEPMFPADSNAPIVYTTDKETVWPKFSYAQFKDANQRKASSDKSNNQTQIVELSSEEKRATVSTIDKTRIEPPENKIDKARIDALENKIDKLTELLAEQSAMIKSMRDNAPEPSALVEQAISAHAQRTASEVEIALSKRWSGVQEALESSGCSAAAAAGVGAARALEPLAAALHHELAAKLSATDRLLRDNIDKLFTSKPVMEQLSTSIAAALSDMVRSAFRDTLLASLLPQLERAHQQMFRQVNQAFHNGTKEFAAATEEAARAAAERGGANAAATLRTALEQHAALLQQQPAIVTQQLADAARQVLEKELGWWREQARSVVTEMSRVHSPASTPAIDRQMQIAQVQSLVNSGDINGAFQMALSASDLSLVMFLCKSVSASCVFAPCRLKQNVLLSLVQQLAADLHHDTQLKHRYLEEAIMNLEPTDQVTREFLPVVVRELQKQIVPFLAANPEHACRRQFKMLLMATESLVKNNV